MNLARALQKSQGDEPIVSSKLNRSTVEQCYTLHEELGKGAFSVVRKGINKQSRREVAIKFIDKKKTRPRVMQAEVDIITDLKHANVVEMHEIFETPTHYSLVQELITGGELLDQIASLERYSEKDASAVMKQLLLALEHLHDKCIVHRDLKPENLLLCNKNPDAKLKLVDFGISKKLSKATQEIFDCSGSPGYMAPEVLECSTYRNGMRGYNFPADMWACGVILYLLLNGKLPFAGEDVSRVNYAISRGDFNFNDPIWQKVSSNAKDLIKGLLVVDQDKRLTVKQSLEHPWVQGVNVASDPLPETQTSIKDFQAARKFKGAVKAVMAIRKMGFTAKDVLLAAKKTAAQLEEQKKQENHTLPTTATAKPSMVVTTKVNAPALQSKASVASAPSSTKNFNKASVAVHVKAEGPSVVPSVVSNKPNPAINNVSPGASETAVSQFYPYQTLITSTPVGVDRSDLPKYLSPDEFFKILQVSKEEFYKMPKWKQLDKKKSAKLF